MLTIVIENLKHKLHNLLFSVLKLLQFKKEDERVRAAGGHKMVQLDQFIKKK